MTHFRKRISADMLAEINEHIVTQHLVKKDGPPKEDDSSDDIRYTTDTSFDLKPVRSVKVSSILYENHNPVMKRNRKHIGKKPEKSTCLQHENETSQLQSVARLYVVSLDIREEIFG
ncbi:MAG: hypothetical protein ACQEQ4_07460, partial [Fibrobacterota bacterium]